MTTLESLCDDLVRTCRCFAGKHWFCLVAAGGYTARVFHSTSCCAVAAVHDLVQAGHVPPTAADVLKILCANYVKHQMRRLFLRRSRSRSPRICERVCERLGLSRENSPVSPEAKPDAAEVDAKPETRPEEVKESGESQRDRETPDYIPLESGNPQKSSEEEPSVCDESEESGEDEEEPAGRGTQIDALMSRVVRIFSTDEPDDGEGWLECAQRFPELQDMVTVYQRWCAAREAVRAVAEESLVRELEVTVASLMSFVDMAMHDEEDDDDDDEEDDFSEASAELCCDTSSDDDEADPSCERDPCYSFLHALDANVSPARFKHLERFRTAFAGRPDGTMREVCMFMLENLECVCLDEEPSMLHTWVDATEHAILSAGSDKCEVIVATRAFFMIERRWPTLPELQEYAGRQRMQSGDPDRFYREERFAVPTPHLERLAASVAQQNSDCSICGSLVEAGSTCYVLSCGHQFHAVDCLGEETIRTWLSVNRRCPVCRVEVSL